MPQFLIPQAEIPKGRALVTGDEVHHIRDVFRMRKGDAIRLFDGHGTGYRGVISGISAREVEVSIEETLREAPRTGPILALGQCLVSKEAMDDIVQRTTELGIDAIIPLIARRSQARPDRKRGAEKHSHWMKRALAACKQCERLTLPRIFPITTIEEWVPTLSSDWQACYADFGGAAVPLEKFIAKKPGGEGGICVIIGPEGGFDDAERALLRGIAPVSLGKTVLRSETAAMFAASLLRSVYSR